MLYPIKNLFSTRAAVILMLLGFFAAAYPIAAQDAVIQRAIESAEAELVTGEYERAYSRARLIIRYYSNADMPAEAQDVSERAVRAYTQELADEDAWDQLLEIEEELADAPPAIRSQGETAFAQAHEAQQEAERQQREQEAQDQALEEEMQRLAELERQQEEEAERQREIEAQREAEREAFRAQQERLRAERDRLDEAAQARIDRILEMNRELEAEREQARQAETEQFLERQAELEQQRAEQEARFRQQLEDAMSSSMASSEQALSTTTTFGYVVIIGLGAAGLIVIGLVILFVVVIVRQQRVQQQQFESTIKTFQAMQATQTDALRTALPFSPDATPSLPGQETALLTDGSEAPSANAEEIRRLLEQCRSYASQIDSVTRRKNAAQAVAELVYKIAVALDTPQETAVLYYAAGLVYDIGFLNIDPELLASKDISEEQFKTIKTHTTLGLNMVFFVPQQYRDIFKDAVSKHHENLDGTGYPYKLKSDEIPCIARIIRVVESYVALVSSRNYRDIMDREAAFDELYRYPNYYDMEIVKTLDTLT